MNVGPGDVAIVIKGRWPNVGRLVRVEHFYRDVPFLHLGYGVLPCWTVESLGGLLDTDLGPAMMGYTPDLSLRKVPGFTPEQLAELRRRAAMEEFQRAAADLAVILNAWERSEAAKANADGAKALAFI